MLPLGILNAALGKPMMIELKDGETYNGHLSACDNFMNITMKEVVQTSANGDNFWRLSEVYIKGQQIKYIRVSDSIIDQVKEQEAELRARGATRGGHHSRGGDRGRGRGAPRGSDRGRGTFRGGARGKA